MKCTFWLLSITNAIFSLHISIIQSWFKVVVMRPLRVSHRRAFERRQQQQKNWIQREKTIGKRNENDNFLLFRSLFAKPTTNRCYPCDETPLWSFNWTLFLPFSLLLVDFFFLYCCCWSFSSVSFFFGMPTQNEQTFFFVTNVIM